MFLSKSLAALCVSLALAGPALADPVKMTMGYATSSDYMAAFVAKAKGYFAKHNIDATMTRIPIITNVPSALVSGSMQAGVATMPNFLQAVDNGLDLVWLAGGGRHVRENPTLSLVIRKDVKFEKPADLMGKKVGISGVNIVMDVLLRKWLRNNGVNDKGFTLIETPLPQMPDMMKNGTLDAVTAVEPIRSAIVNSGAGYVGAEFIADVNPDIFLAGWITTGEWARKNPEAVKNFRAAVDEALAYINSNPPDLKDIEKEFLGYNAPRWSKFSNTVPVDEIKLYIDIGKELGLYRSNMDAAKLVAP